MSCLNKLCLLEITPIAFVFPNSDYTPEATAVPTKVVGKF